MSGTYHLPSSSTRVTSSFQDHNDRNPPSVQPGTDYGVNKGSACYAPSAGKVLEISTSTGPSNDGQGRYVSIMFDDGHEGRALHMDRVDVKVGQRVTRGQKIGLTGASGYGSDYYYGPHVHQTLWKGGSWSTPELDFELYVGESAPTPSEPEEDEMAALKGATYPRKSDGATVCMLFNEGSGFWVLHTGGGGGYNNPIAQMWETGSWPSLTESHALAIQRSLDAVKAGSASASAVAVNVDDTPLVKERTDG